MQSLYFILTNPVEERLATLAINAIQARHTESGLSSPIICIAEKTEAVVRPRSALKRVFFGDKIGLELIKSVIVDLLKIEFDYVIFVSPDVILTNPPLWVMSGNDFCGFSNAGNLAANFKTFAIRRDLLEKISLNLNTMSYDMIAESLQFYPTICTLGTTLSSSPKVFPPAAKGKLFIGQFCAESLRADAKPLYVMDCSGGWLNPLASVSLSTENLIFLAMRSVLRKQKC